MSTHYSLLICMVLVYMKERADVKKIDKQGRSGRIKERFADLTREVGRMAAIRVRSMVARGVAIGVETSQTNNPEEIRPQGMSVVITAYIIMRLGLVWPEGQPLTAEDALALATKLQGDQTWFAEKSVKLTQLVKNPVVITRYKSPTRTRARYMVEGNGKLFDSLTDALKAAGFDLDTYQQMD